VVNAHDTVRRTPPIAALRGKVAVNSTLGREADPGAAAAAAFLAARFLSYPPSTAFAVSPGDFSMALQPGTAAPDFSLASHNGETLSLSSFRGRPTIVSFLPFAFTGG
jgi:hypothetical protein